MNEPTTAPDGEDGQYELVERVEEYLDAEDDAGAAALLREEQPADVADALNDLRPELDARLFPYLDTEMAADVIDELSLERVQLLAESSPEAVAQAAGLMEPDELVDLLESVEDEQRGEILRQLPAETASTARGLMVHEADTAGGIMTPEFIVLSENITADEAVKITQRSRERETIAHIFVCDEDEHLVGHLPLHRLVFARPNRKLKELYDPEVVTVAPDTDQEEVVRLATRYGLDVVPVVDENEEMRGVITVDDILEAGQAEADEDIYRLAGTGERDPVRATIVRSTRLRLPWLLITLFGGLGIAFMVSQFEGTLQSVQIAFFIPLIPLMGGNVAIQSSAIVVRGLAVGDIHTGRLMYFVSKQWVVTLLLAVLCGGAAGLVGAFFPDVGPKLPLVVGTAIGTAIILAGTLGTLLPLLFDRIGWDPAVSAGPFVTLLNDVLCITIYLSLGQLAIQ